MAPPDFSELIMNLWKDEPVNALHQAQSAYRSNAEPIRTKRAIEYDAFANITRRMKAASALSKGNIRDLITAIHDNRKLWSILALDVAGNENGLPQDLRARILYLSEFTRTYSSRVLNGASIEPLIEINTAVMRGLRNRSANS